MSKITEVRTTRLDFPTEVPVTAARGAGFTHLGLLWVEVVAGDQCRGQGYALFQNGFGLDVVNAMVLALRPLVVGRSLGDIGAINADARKRVKSLGLGGVSMTAISVLDQALWDARGHDLVQPLHRLWGACEQEVPVYASGRFWLAQPLETVVADAKDAVARGFRALKLRIGSDRWQDDVTRVAAVRDAVGPDIEIMVDGNQGLQTVGRAIRLAKALTQFDIAWFEEPLPADDIDGTAKIAASIDIPLAGGENLYTLDEFRNLIESGAGAVVMPDLQRCGGYSGMLQIARLCEAHRVQISPHIWYRQSLHVVAATGAGTWVEYTGTADRLCAQAMAPLKGGRLQVPDLPGAGVVASAEFVKKHEVKE